MKGNRNRGPHQVQQNLDPANVTQSLKRADKIGKRSRQDANLLAFDEVAVEACQLAVRLRNQGILRSRLAPAPVGRPA